MAKGMTIPKDAIQKLMLRRMFNWVDSIFKQELPPEIYSTAHSGNPSEKMRINRWLNEQGYRLVSPGEGMVQLWKGANKIHEAKLVLEMDDPEVMLQLAELVQKHVNIPKPPWVNGSNEN